MLERAFPDDPIVGEEDASDLRVEAGAVLRQRVVELANAALTAELVLGDDTRWGIGPGTERSAEELLTAVDRGNHIGGRTGREYRATMCCEKNC
jgi:3'(2'), 5'-bisphosphate nucleotidase